MPRGAQHLAATDCLQGKASYPDKHYVSQIFNCLPSAKSPDLSSLLISLKKRQSKTEENLHMVRITTEFAQTQYFSQYEITLWHLNYLNCQPPTKENQWQSHFRQETKA